MIGIADAFSTSYAQARVKFLEAAATAGLQIESHQHPLLGVDGETLAMDVAFDPSTQGESSGKCLIVSSACHGVEGYCGSGVQTFALHDAEWLSKARDSGVAVLYIHALNPYGFSYKRRVTNENVDLNRNFHDFDKHLPLNIAYRELSDLLMPATWPPSAQNMATLQNYIAANGLPALQAAVSGGQHEFPQGLFFGGNAPTWSNQTLRLVLRKYLQKTRQLAWIDIHTGLGPNGLGERIFASAADASALTRARAWWGGEQPDGTFATPITMQEDGTSTSAKLTGQMQGVMAHEFAHVQHTGMALEFGTKPPMEVLMALWAENWLHHHPEAPAELAKNVKQGMLDAFFTDTDAWKGQIVSQSRQAMFQAVNGLNV
ncbi:MAG: hypothetical protein RL018_1469 [Pseudomonadota bacterium]